METRLGLPVSLSGNEFASSFGADTSSIPAGSTTETATFGSIGP
jgi:hypothetical protein